MVLVDWYRRRKEQKILKDNIALLKDDVAYWVNEAIADIPKDVTGYERIEVLLFKFKSHIDKASPEELDHYRRIATQVTSLNCSYSNLRNFLDQNGAGQYKELIETSLAIQCSQLNEENMEEVRDYIYGILQGTSIIKTLEAFLDADDIYLQPGTNEYLALEYEVAGFSRLHTVEGEKKGISIELINKSKGGRHSVHLREPMAYEYMGVWHYHPTNVELTIESESARATLLKKLIRDPHIFEPPIPSEDDLAPGGHMLFDCFPHIIICQAGARLYLPQFLADIASPGLRARFVPYGTKERIDELKKTGLYREPESGILSFGYGYIGLQIN